MFDHLNLLENLLDRLRVIICQFQAGAELYAYVIALVMVVKWSMHDSGRWLSGQFKDFLIPECFKKTHYRFQ